jgi:hypothetical protein
MSDDRNNYDLAMKMLSLEKELTYKKNLQYQTVEERDSALKDLQSQIAELAKNTNDAPEPYEDWNMETIPESAPETLEAAAVAAVPEPIPATAPEAPVSLPRNRRSLQDVYTGLGELYRWLLDQSPTTAMSIGASLGFLHGCIWCLLFPRFVSFLLFLLASSLAMLGVLAYRDVDMTPRQRDSITVCYGFFGVLAAVMLALWLSY